MQRLFKISKTFLKIFIILTKCIFVFTIFYIFTDFIGCSTKVYKNNKNNIGHQNINIMLSYILSYINI